MRYNKYFQQHLNNEWEDYYVEYERIRLLLGKTSNRTFCNTLLYELQKSNAYCLLLADKAVRESSQFYNILKGLTGEKKLIEFKIILDKCRNGILNDISHIRKDKEITKIPNEWSSDSDNQGDNSQSYNNSQQSYNSSNFKEGGNGVETFILNKEECFNEVDDLSTKNNEKFMGKNIKKYNSKPKSKSKRFIKNILPMGKSYSIEKKKKRLYMILDDILKIYKFKRLNLTAVNKLRYKFLESIKDLDNSRSLLSSQFESTFIFKDKNLKILKDATKNIFKEIFENEEIKGETSVYDRITKVHKNNFFILLLSGIFIGLNSFSIYKYCIDLIDIKKEFYNFEYSNEKILKEKGLTEKILKEKGLNSYYPLFYLGKFLGFNNFFYSVILFVFCIEIFKSYKINSTFIFRFNKISKLTNQNLIVITTFVQSFYLFLKFKIFDIRTVYLNTINDSYYTNISNTVNSFYNFSFLNDLILHITLYLECYFFLLCIIFLIIPLKFFYVSTRLYLPAIYARNICLPLTKVTFRHFYFIGLAQSLKYPLQQLILTFMGNKKNPLDNKKKLNIEEIDEILTKGYFFGSYYSPNDKSKFISEMFLLIFPFIRIFQCYKRFNDSGLIMPHVVNSIKYLIYIISTILYQMVAQNIKNANLIKNLNSGFFLDQLDQNSLKDAKISSDSHLFKYNHVNLNDFSKVFLITILVCYVFSCLIWDIFIDFVIKRGKYLYPDFVYGLICVFDVLYKPAKIIKLFFYKRFLNQSEEKRIFIDFFISTSGLIFKFLWTIIRVEVEHLNNCDKLKIDKNTLISLCDFFYENDTGDLENNDAIIELKKGDFTSTASSSNGRPDKENNVDENREDLNKEDLNRQDENRQTENRQDNGDNENLSEGSNCTAIDINSEVDTPIYDQLEIDMNVYSSDSDSLYSE